MSDPEILTEEKLDEILADHPHPESVARDYVVHELIFNIREARKELAKVREEHAVVIQNINDNWQGLYNARIEQANAQLSQAKAEVERLQSITLHDTGRVVDAEAKVVALEVDVATLRRDLSEAYEAIRKSQAVLAGWIVPDSIVTDAEALDKLLGILDDKKLVAFLTAQKARDGE
jgi:hypothetical protein